MTATPHDAMIRLMTLMTTLLSIPPSLFHLAYPARDKWTGDVTEGMIMHFEHILAGAGAVRRITKYPVRIGKISRCIDS